MSELNKKIKSYIDANVWDGEDRAGSMDVAHCTPDFLQELCEEVVEYLLEDSALVPLEPTEEIIDLVSTYIDRHEDSLADIYKAMIKASQSNNTKGDEG